MSSKQIATHYLSAPLVAKRYSVSPRTIDRWDDTPDLGFPPPIFKQSSFPMLAWGVFLRLRLPTREMVFSPSTAALTLQQ
jgi:hypothetical protein